MYSYACKRWVANDQIKRICDLYKTSHTQNKACHSHFHPRSLNEFTNESYYEFNLYEMSCHQYMYI